MYVTFFVSLNCIPSNHSLRRNDSRCRGNSLISCSFHLTLASNPRQYGTVVVGKATLGVCLREGAEAHLRRVRKLLEGKELWLPSTLSRQDCPVGVALFAARRAARLHALRGASAGRPMPWVNRPPQSCGLKGRENLGESSRLRLKKISGGLSGRVAVWRFLPRASAYRPKPWARISRPFGPHKPQATPAD